jgi:hypothetical protein
MTTTDIDILLGYVKDALTCLRNDKEKAIREWDNCKTQTCKNEKLSEIIDQHRKIRKIVMELKDELDPLV